MVDRLVRTVCTLAALFAVAAGGAACTARPSLRDDRRRLRARPRAGDRRGARPRRARTLAHARRRRRCTCTPTGRTTRAKATTCSIPHATGAFANFVDKHGARHRVALRREARRHRRRRPLRRLGEAARQGRRALVEPALLARRAVQIRRRRRDPARRRRRSLLRHLRQGRRHAARLVRRDAGRAIGACTTPSTSRRGSRR